MRIANKLVYTFMYDFEEMLTLAENHMMIESNLDKVYVDVAVSYPGGVRKEWRTPHRIGDYFNSIKIVPNMFLRCTTIELDVKEDAGRFWKDLAVHILRINRYYKGKETKWEIKNS